MVLLTCSYQNQEFIRVGYYVNNEYADPEMKENPPMEPVFAKLQRNILATCPRVTRFKIDWGDGEGGSNENQPPVTTEGLGDPMECGGSKQGLSENSNMDAPLKQLANTDNSNSMEVVLNEKSLSQNGLPREQESMQV